MRSLEQFDRNLIRGKENGDDQRGRGIKLPNRGEIDGAGS